MLSCTSSHTRSQEDFYSTVLLDLTRSTITYIMIQAGTDIPPPRLPRPVGGSSINSLIPENMINK